MVFVPYRGFCYLYNTSCVDMVLLTVVFVPYRGFCYLYNMISLAVDFFGQSFSSPIGAFVIYTLPPCNPLNKQGAEHIFGLKNFMYINYVLQFQKSLESGLFSLSAQTLQSKAQNHSSYFYIMYTFSYEAIPQTSQDP